MIDKDSPGIKIAEDGEFAHSSNKLEFDSVLDIISDYAVSERSKLAIKNLRPLSGVSAIEASQNEVMELLGFRQSGGNIPITGWLDTRDILAGVKVEGSIIEGEELLQIAKSELKTVEIKKTLDRNRESLETLGKISERMISCGNTAKRIISVIGDDFELLDTASKDLSRIRKRINETRMDLRKRFGEYISNVSEGGEFVTVRGNRYVISLPRKAASRIKGAIHHESASGASVFIEPIELIEGNNRLESYIQEERKEVAKILKALTSEVFEKRGLLVGNQDVVARIDVINAKSLFAETFRCCKPLHSKEGRFILREARHPYLERRIELDDRDGGIIGLDLDLVRSERVLVISGPNAGGKTVALKTIGLIVMMDRCGLPVPAMAGTDIPDFRRILVDIGDDQSIKNSLSTFSSRALRMKKVLDTVDTGSIVLVDEIGDGTSQEEGAAIAEAFLERLNRVGCMAVVTTHFTSLKGWAFEESGAVNANLGFDTVNLKPLYRMQLGVPGRSWGLETARRMGIDEEIIRAAEEKIETGSQELEGLLAYLAGKKAELEKDLRLTKEKDEKLERLTVDFGKRIYELEKNKEELARDARKEALRIISDARADIESLVRDIRKGQADKESIRKAKVEINRKKAALEREIKKSQIVEPIGPDEVKPGSWVEVKSLRKRGRVISVEKKGKAFIELEGGLKAEVRIDDLGRSEETRATKAEKKIRWTASTGDSIDTEIMIRGLERAEALERIDIFIDRAVLHGLERVRIIHGIGKGILKRAVYNKLRNDPRVREVHPGEPSVGGDGVAVVELK